MAQQPLEGEDVSIIEDSRSHLDTSHSLGLPWTSDQTDAEASTWQQTTFARDIHAPGLFEPQPQQESSRRPTLASPWN